MAKFIFSGIIHPERAPFHMNAPATAEIQLPGIGAMIKAIAQIIKNQVLVTVDVVDGDVDIATLKHVVDDLVRNLTESFGIMFAMAHSVEITSVTSVETNDVFVFGVDMKDVVDVGDGVLADTSKVTMVIGRNPFIRRAVTDVVGAIRRADDTGFLCYRAFEAVLQHVKKRNNIGDKNKCQAITQLVQAIDINRDDIDFLWEISKDSRHGKPVGISGADRVRAIRIARDIVLKMVDFVAVDTES